jgi:penicillin-binding protein 1C
MVLALRLEHRFSKREVLALYLNLAAYGNQTAGAARASYAYFGVDPAMLTPAQAAFLAALPQRPTAFNPWKNAASARNRQLAVIERMAHQRMLTAEQVREARDERLALRPRVNPFRAPHFVEMVRAAEGRPAEARSPKADRIETTIDLDLQQDVEGIIDHERPLLKTHGAANVAVVVLDNHRSEWLAWEGSGDYSDTDHGGAINGPAVPRQPGSALKPFTYALAFEQGRTPATVLPDIPAHFPTAEAGVVYSPRNYDGRYRGPLLARTALAGSENVPAVALASDLGVDALLRFLTRAGLSTFDRTPSYYGLGLTLGNAEVRLDELVAAYATFARGGVWIRPSAVPRPDELPRRLVSERPRSGSPRSRATLTRGPTSRTRKQPEFPPLRPSRRPRRRITTTGRSAIRATSQSASGWELNRTPLREWSGVTGATIFHAVMLAAQKQRRRLPEASEILGRPADWRTS